MRRFLLYIPLSLSALAIMILASGWNNSSHSSQLEWRDGRDLTWLDFRGKAQPRTGVDALSSCGILCDPSIAGEGKIQFRVSAYFSRPHSWVDKEDANRKLLAHEQGHFDIGEIYARRLRQKLARTTFSSKNLNDQIQAVYDDVFEDYREAQARYDKETRHSTVLKSQIIWEDWIEKQLRDSRDWAGYYVASPLHR